MFTSDNHNLVLVARWKEILDEKANELKAAFDVVTIALDLAETDSIEKLDTATKEMDIGLIVPNAGEATNGNFLKIPLRDQKKVLQLNSMIPMQMAHLFGNRLVNRGKGG